MICHGEFLQLIVNTQSGNGCLNPVEISLEDGGNGKKSL